MRWKALVLGIGVAITGAGEHARATTGTINYQIGSGSVVPETSEQDITINVGTVSGTVVLRIWDPSPDSTTGLPDDGVGKITITGSWSSGGELRVLVAGNTTWPGQPDDVMTSAGLRDLGLNSSDGIEVTNADLRKHTRLAAFVSGDIHGVIEVGQVQRIQCGFSTSGAAGTIHADITAIALNELYSMDAIGRIYAGDAILGDITATGDGTYDPDDASTYASIGRIVVGPETDAAGIMGSIRAEKGSITTIFTTGPIGSATQSIQPEIHAATRVEQIRAAVEDSATILERDFHFDVRADNPVIAGDPFNDGVIQLIRTGGAISGLIKADILSYGSAGTRAGIIAGGPITADIEIDILVNNADIIGSSITGDVTIGLQAIGSIVATAIDEGDPNRGRIESVEIGFGESIPEDYTDVFQSGFIGPICEPVNVTTPSVWYEQSLCTFAGGSVDSTIWAAADVEGASIGSVRISRMTKTYRFPLDKNNYISRVESPLIEQLEIGDLREGVVWSGLLEFDASVPDDDYDNDYAQMAECSIGCIGPAGQVWFFGCSRAEIVHDVLGELHLSSLEAGETVWIGGRLGDGPPDHDEEHEGPGMPCDCDEQQELPWDCWVYTYGFLDEDSPRDTNYAAVGRIVVRQEEGLHGQVIVNGDDAAATWDGDVIIADELGVDNRIVVTPDTGHDEFDPDFEAPYYTSPSGAVGDGAVGLAPFHFYPEDCSPPDKEYRLVTDFSAYEPIYVAFYGPLKAANPSEPIAHIIAHRPYRDYDDADEDPDDPDFLENWSSVDVLFSISIDTANPRRLKVVPSPTIPVVAPGEYRLKTTSNLRCLDVDGEPAAGVAEYWFWLALDCNNNDIADVGDFLDPEGGCDVEVDCNCNLINDCCDIIEGGAPGNPSTCELDPAMCSANCDCDFNADERLNTQDLFDFIACFFSADPLACGADFNKDDVVNSQDFFDFLACFFAGCDN